MFQSNISITSIFRIKEQAKQEINTNSLPPASVHFLLGLFFDPKNGGSIFL
jgi:hypothetical protein